MWYIEGSFLQPKLVSKFLVCVPPVFSPFCTYTRPFFDQGPSLQIASEGKGDRAVYRPLLVESGSNFFPPSSVGFPSLKLACSKQFWVPSVQLGKLW